MADLETLLKQFFDAAFAAGVIGASDPAAAGAAMGLLPAILANVNAQVIAENEACAKLMEISTQQMKLKAGEMSAQEVRTTRAVLSGRAAEIRWRKDFPETVLTTLRNNFVMPAPANHLDIVDALRAAKMLFEECSMRKGPIIEKIDAALENSRIPVEPFVPKGYAIVPLHVNREMQRIMDDEGWEWADLLAAAGAVTESEYDEACSGVPGQSLRQTCAEAAYKLSVYVQIYTGDKQARRLVKELTAIAESTRSAPEHSSVTGAAND